MPRAPSGTPTSATSTVSGCARAGRCWPRPSGIAAPSPARSAADRTRGCSSWARSTAGPGRRNPAAASWRSRRPRPAPGDLDRGRPAQRQEDSEAGLYRPDGPRLVRQYGYLFTCHGRLTIRRAIEQYQRSIDLGPATTRSTTCGPARRRRSGSPKTRSPVTKSGSPPRRGRRARPRGRARPAAPCQPAHPTIPGTRLSGYARPPGPAARRADTRRSASPARPSTGVMRSSLQIITTVRACRTMAFTTPRPWAPPVGLGIGELPACPV